jgi:hypothetical protein
MAPSIKLDGTKTCGTCFGIAAGDFVHVNAALHCNNAGKTECYYCFTYSITKEAVLTGSGGLSCTK